MINAKSNHLVNEDDNVKPKEYYRLALKKMIFMGMSFRFTFLVGTKIIQDFIINRRQTYLIHTTLLIKRKQIF